VPLPDPVLGLGLALGATGFCGFEAGAGVGVGAGAALSFEFSSSSLSD
jgi:hypothetical protein